MSDYYFQYYWYSVPCSLSDYLKTRTWCFGGLDLLSSSGGGGICSVGSIRKSQSQWYDLSPLGCVIHRQGKCPGIQQYLHKTIQAPPHSHMVTRPTYRSVPSGAFIHSVKHIHHSYVPNSHPCFKWFREYLQMTPFHHVSSSCEIWLAFNPLKSELRLNNI
jgi:hypothetical protein